MQIHEKLIINFSWTKVATDKSEQEGKGGFTQANPKLSFLKAKCRPKWTKQSPRKKISVKVLLKVLRKQQIVLISFTGSVTSGPKKGFKFSPAEACMYWSRMDAILANNSVTNNCFLGEGRGKGIVLQNQKLAKLYHESLFIDEKSPSNNF